jgi:hypothetical protein
MLGSSTYGSSFEVLPEMVRLNPSRSLTRGTTQHFKKKTLEWFGFFTHKWNQESSSGSDSFPPKFKFKFKKKRKK